MVWLQEAEAGHSPGWSIAPVPPGKGTHTPKARHSPACLTFFPFYLPLMVPHSAFLSHFLGCEPLQLSHTCRLWYTTGYWAVDLFI